MGMFNFGKKGIDKKQYSSEKIEMIMDAISEDILNDDAYGKFKKLTKERFVKEGRAFNLVSMRIFKDGFDCAIAAKESSENTVFAMMSIRRMIKDMEEERDKRVGDSLKEKETE